MLLDLGRNDVGRVAEIGSVEVTDTLLHRALQPRHAHRLQRRGRARPAARRDRRADRRLPRRHRLRRAEGARDGDHRRTGEVDKRGLYAGCVGYFAANGEMDTCIVLRTALVKDGAHVRAGRRRHRRTTAMPENEQQECVNKAQALFRAAEEAVRFASSARRGQ